ncbi:two-component sensor histidine kinase [Paenibacillus agaridevorans]|uniref:histidine kinase n=1 Tax=Paenibacillus agaridevorans TaxID=171404 RepID=A0A2R5EXP3_9BACL|nr:histidine kinase [Paenibacillus agaridevorans]GBG11486.1 two-component sensor histidine kinase [Paenibacillus agaridevorans]
MWSRWIPKTLTYRLFGSFLIFIVIPFLIIQMYTYGQIEKMIGRQLSDKNNEQLNFIINNLNHVRSDLFAQMLQLELNPVIVELLEQPGGDADANAGMIAPILEHYRSQYAPYGENYVRFELSDRYGNVYGNAAAVAVQNPEWRELPEFQTAAGSREGFQWVSGNELSLYSVIRSEEQIIGWLRVTFDYAGWLHHFSRNLLIQQDYIILDRDGRVLARTKSNIQLQPDVIARIRALQHDKASFVDQKNALLINAGYIRPMNWYIASAFTLDIYFGSLDHIKKQLFITFMITAALFVLITFGISSGITRPLKLLERKMSDMGQEKFQKSMIPEGKYRGEMLSLAQTFNRMVDDIRSLIQQLKMEVREREAIRQQMLLIQMNPHFLLNTLNLIKWNVHEKGDRETTDICIALGTLLEQSLASEEEVIHLYKERELVQAYDYIQQIRFDRRFHVRYEIQPELNYALVPKFILQPLVENSINYAFSRRKQDGLVTIRAYTDEEKLVLEVEDNGSGYRAHEKTDKRRRKGIGLANIRERLNLLFRNDSELTIVEMEPGTRVTVRMPLLLAAPNEPDDGGRAE